MQQWLARFDTQKLDRLAPIVFFLLMVWLCWRLANLFWWFVAPPQLPTIQPVVLGSQQPVMPNIVRFSLFEEAGQDPRSQQAQSPVALKLEGVLLAKPNYLSSAVIRSENQANSYRVGANIGETGYTLAEVYWDRVVVRHQNGQSNEIKFGEVGANTTPVAPPVSNEPSSPPPATQPTQTSPLTSAIEQLQTDRDQYLNKMGVMPGQGGFEVTERTPPALRARLGLRPGDKVVSVNGQPLGGGINEAQLLDQIRKTGQAKIEIQRGDQMMTIQQSF